MSADNFNIIRRHPSGGFTYVMDFASSEEAYPEAKINSPRFESFALAMDEAQRDDAEYGVRVHPECYEKIDIDSLSHVKENLLELKQTLKNAWLEEAKLEVIARKLHNAKLAEENNRIPSIDDKGEYPCGHSIPHFLHFSDETNYCIECKQFDLWWKTFKKLGAFSREFY
jgi:hypothetical protein